MNKELKEIKKLYGEEMMHLCRDLFPSILEQEGTLLEILKAHIAPSHNITPLISDNDFKDDFKNWIYNLANVQDDDLPDTNKTPFELMKEAGYTLYECKNEEDIQSFKHYYRRDEELCTFRGRRLERCHVFFAVKDNVDEIKREDFPNPERQDKYGTSVISIQFSRGEINNLSIKNRYNHTVNNPDATFSNNLENIIPGLTKSFEKQYNLDISKNTTNMGLFMYDLSFVLGDDNRFYLYNMEWENVYYCENNIIIYCNKVDDTYSKNKERYLLIDNYLIDFKEKTIVDLICGRTHALLGIEGKIEKIEIEKKDRTRIIHIYYPNNQFAKIEINSNNSVLGIENEFAEEIGDDFFDFSREFQYFKLPNVKHIGNNFLEQASSIEKVDLPNLETVGKYFISMGEKVNSINLPKLRYIDDNFLHNNIRLTEVDLPSVETIGDGFLSWSKMVESIHMPLVNRIDSEFLYHNSKLKTLDLPELEYVEDNFLRRNNLIQTVDLPKLVKTGFDFMSENKTVTTINLPRLEKVESDFLPVCNISKLYLPSLTKVGDRFLCCCTIPEVSLPNLKTYGEYLLGENKNLVSIELADNFESDYNLPGMQSDIFLSVIKNKKNKKER